MKKTLMILILVVSACFSSQTWVLTEDLSLAKTAEQGDTFVLDFAAIKKATDLSQTEEMLVLAWEFEKKYPELTAGEDWKAYFTAETAFAKRNWRKSADLFLAFLDEYPVSKFYPAALERTYEIASAYLAGQKRRVFGIFMIRGYDDGEVMMRKIADKAGRSTIAQRALITLAESFENRGLFLDAYNVWTEVSVRWQTGEVGRQSLLAMARCMHSAYEGHSYDGSPIISAEGYYSQYKLRYPLIAQEQGVGEYYDMTIDQIAYKNYMTGYYYHKTGDYQSAIMYYNYVIENISQSDISLLAQERMDEIANMPPDLVRIKPEDKSLLWRFWHFFDFNPTKSASEE